MESKGETRPSLDAIRAGLPDKLRAQFDAMRVEGADYETLSAMARDGFEALRLSDKQGDEWRKAEDLDRRQERCAFKYLNENKAELPVDDIRRRHAVIDMFYGTDEPESLMGLPVSDLLSRHGTAFGPKGGVTA